jgi:membrane protease YdiL (CAAX protease family)
VAGRPLSPHHAGFLRSVRFCSWDLVAKVRIIVSSIVPTSSPAPSTSVRYCSVAGPVHTIVVLAAVGCWAFGSRILGHPLVMAPGSHRVRIYLISALFEWCMFALVVAGARSRGTSTEALLGSRWRSGWHLLRDVGIAAVFWIVAMALLWLLRLLWHFSPDSKILYLLPHGVIEAILWVGLAVTAGICEETIFRAYLQRQFMAVTQSAPIGILLSATTFGAAHVYQGLWMILPLSLYGAMFGILAHWRRSVRPEMIAHAWHDALVGIIVSFMRH